MALNTGVYCVYASDLFQAVYKTNSWKEVPTYKFRMKEKLPKDGVFFSIFSLGQEGKLEALKKLEDVNIIYEGTKAINRNYGTKQLRNQVVVWEFKQDGEGSKV